MGQARAAVAHARELVEDVEFSPMDATRSELEFTAEVVADAIEEGATTINIPDTVGYAMPHEYAAWLERLYELVPGAARRRALGALPRRSRAGGRQLVRRRAAGARQVECAINGIGERAGNASLEEIVMLLRTRAADLGLRHGVNTREIARTSRLVSRLTGYAGAAQQGDRRAQRLRARVGHPPGRRAEGAHDLRDHGRHERRPGRQLARARQALRAPRAAPGAREPGLSRSRARRSTPRSSASRRSPTARRRSARWISRRWSPTSCASRHRRGYTLESYELEAGASASRTRRSSCARPTARACAARSAATARSTRSSPRSTPRPASTRACASSAIDAVTEGKDALGEVSVVVGGERSDGLRARASRPTSSRPRRAPTCGRSRRSTRRAAARRTPGRRPQADLGAVSRPSAAAARRWRVPAPYCDNVRATYGAARARALSTRPPCGPRVRALREAMGLSLRELALRCGVSAAMLSQVERGETSPTLRSRRGSPPASSCASRSCCASTRAAR